MYVGDEVEYLNDTQRVRVEVDAYTESPLEWGWGTEIHEIDNYRIWMSWETPEDPLAYAAYLFQQKVRSGDWTEENRDRAMHLCMMLIGDTRVFEFQGYQGYSKSDWATVLVLWDEDKGANVYEDWAAWRRGDVFTVVFEELIAKCRCLDCGVDWVETDSMGGCYLDEDYTATVVANEYFDVKKEED